MTEDDRAATYTRRAAPRPPRARRQPEQLAAVLRLRRRRRGALERRVRRRSRRLRRAAEVVRGPGAAGVLPARAVARAGAARARSTTACGRCTSTRSSTTGTNPERIAGGTQDNGSWETLGDQRHLDQRQHRRRRPQRVRRAGRRPELPAHRLAAGAARGELHAAEPGRHRPGSRTRCSSSTATRRAVHRQRHHRSGHARLDCGPGREHVFRSTNYGRNPVFPRPSSPRCTATCGTATATSTRTAPTSRRPTSATTCSRSAIPGQRRPADRCRATAPTAPAATSRSVERATADTNTLWAATSTGRIFVSKNATNANPASVTFVRLDTRTRRRGTRPRSSWTRRTRTTPGSPTAATTRRRPRRRPRLRDHLHARTREYTGTAAFTLLDGNANNGYGDIPANSIVVSPSGTVYVGNDYGVVQKQKNSGVWHPPAAGLPNVDVADLVYVPEKGVLYAGTHGQGVWQLKVQ